MASRAGSTLPRRLFEPRWQEVTVHFSKARGHPRPGEAAARHNRLRHPSGGVILLFGLVVAGTACSRDNPNDVPPRPDFPPNLSGVITDEDGTARTLVSLLGVLEYGDTVTGAVPPPHALIGYEFEAFRGAFPVIELAIDSATDDPQALPEGEWNGAVSLYGPRTQLGLWNDVLTRGERAGTSSLVIDDFEIDEPGMYLILIQTYGDAQPSRETYALHLGCRGNCGAPTCPGLEPCERVCGRGYEVAADGCRQCACLAAQTCDPANPVECRRGQFCNSEGQCADQESPCDACPSELDPVCGRDEVTYGNRCLAECAEVEIAREGRCEHQQTCDERRPCRSPEICDGGRCVVPECDCSDAVRPVCSTSGRQYRNECHIRCYPDEEVAYIGPCVDNSCRDNDACRSGEVCTFAPLPGNRERCQEDPDSRRCIRVCLPRQMAQCDASSPCAEGLWCYRGPSGELGRCVTLCDLRAEPDGPGSCPPATLCANIEQRGLPNHAGLCQPACRAESVCPPPMSCLPDRSERLVCQLCACEHAPNEPVCGPDNVTYPTPCHARCAGVRGFRRGPCESPGECICSHDPRPVCGLDGRLYNNACELRCGGVRPDHEQRCIGEPRPRLGCETHDACSRTGADGQLCASAPSDVEIDRSPDAMCVAEHGNCRCIRNRCSFEVTRDAHLCIDAHHAESD